MRFSKTILIILCIFLCFLIAASVILFYRLSLIQQHLITLQNNNLLLFDNKTDIRLIYLLVSLTAGTGIISILFFILTELSKKFTIISHRNKSFSTSNNNNGLQNKSDHEIFYQTESNQLQAEEILNKIKGITQKQDTIHQVSKQILIALAEFFQIVQGEIYFIINNKIKLHETYAYYVPEGKIIEFEIGDGLIGQVAKEKKPLTLDNIPENYITVVSGLGKATPSNLIIFPLLSGNTLIGIIELASFSKFTKNDEALCMKISDITGNYLSHLLSQNQQVYNNNDEN